MPSRNPPPQEAAIESQSGFIAQLAEHSMQYFLVGAVTYFFFVTVVLVFTAPPEFKTFLVLQKSVYMVILTALAWRQRQRALPALVATNLDLLIFVLALSSCLFSTACGVTARFSLYCCILVFAGAVMDIPRNRVFFNWILVWLCYGWVDHFHPSPTRSEDLTKLILIQLTAIPFMNLRMMSYRRRFELLTQLSRALEESEQIRDHLDQAVENRTTQLKMAYEELHKSVQERECITQEREKLHEQLLQSQKLDALGRLAGGVAHDFNNLLTVIMGNLELAEISPPQDVPSILGEASTAARRASELTAQLLAFSRKQVLTIKPLPIQKIVEEAMRMVKRLVGEDIRVETDLGCPDATVEGDASQLQQVILNLVINARDAMPEGGTLLIGLHAVGTEIELSVSDSGYGIDPALHASIFEPFFTNKPFGQGTGLGLSTVDGIVSMHAGRIELTSKPGEGAIFRVYLPISLGEPGESMSRRPLQAPTGSGMILLVEDDAQVRSLTLRVLKQAGYQVTAAENAEEALAILDGERGFHLMITDVVMPGMDGGKLAVAARGKLPDLPVLFISGYADDRLSQFGIERGECDFLGKPFSATVLQKTVAEILARKAVVA